MKSIINQISRYHIINYLIPGLFVMIASKCMTNIAVCIDKMWVICIIGYVTGMVLNRLGSLVIEGVLMRFKLIKHAPIECYVRAEKKDKKIQELLTDANMYRTMSVASIALVIECIYLSIIGLLIPMNATMLIIVLVLMGMLFFASYIKQTRHIVGRVNAIKEKNKNV